MNFASASAEGARERPLFPLTFAEAACHQSPDFRVQEGKKIPLSNVRFWQRRTFELPRRNVGNVPNYDLKRYLKSRGFTLIPSVGCPGVMPDPNRKSGT